MYQVIVIIGVYLRLIDAVTVLIVRHLVQTMIGVGFRDTVLKHDDIWAQLRVLLHFSHLIWPVGDCKDILYPMGQMIT